jgi:hypothetical protein
MKRRIHSEWIARLISKGLKAAEIWPPLFGEIKKCWQGRFGHKEINRLRESVQAVVGQAKPRQNQEPDLCFEAAGEIYLARQQEILDQTILPPRCWSRPFTPKITNIPQGIRLLI